jgi:hypothetical protein
MLNFRAVLLFALFTTTACGNSFRAESPSGFVKLDDDAHPAYAYRATTADGFVIGVRELQHSNQGDLGFWVNAVKNTLRARNGYALLEERNAKTRSGLAGKSLLFGHDEGQQAHRYLVTVFVTDAHIFVIEAGGKQDQMQQHADDVQTFISAFGAS